MAGDVARVLTRHIDSLIRHTPELHHANTVIVALSGGLDSVCMLHLLRFAAHAPQLRAAHFDHGMRAGSSADAHWVRGLCSAWDVPLDSERAEPPPRGETEARAQRHAFLDRCAERHAAALILLAHHADDQAETVLFRLARGTGLPGLAGMTVRRGRLLRPLLGFTRAHLRAYARANALSWRDDPSNLDARFARNRIRLEVLPALEAMRPGAALRIAGLASHVADAESAWQGIVEAALRHVVVSDEPGRFTLAREGLLAYHPHVRARVLRHVMQRLGAVPGRAGTRAAAAFINSGATGKRVELPGGISLSREWDRLVAERDANPPAPDEELEIRSTDRGSSGLVIGGRRFRARWALTMRGDVSDETATFDPSALRFPLVLRSWRAGDRIRLAHGSSKLKKLFPAHRIGRDSRNSVPVLSDAAGRVLWVRGVARAAWVGPTSETVFEISVVDGDSR